MADDLQRLRVFINECKPKAEKLLSESHVGIDVKLLLQDYVYIGKATDELIRTTTDADFNILKKRYEVAKRDLRAATKLIEKFLQIYPDLESEFQLASKEALYITKRTKPTDLDYMSADVINSAIGRIAETIKKIHELIPKEENKK